MTASYTQSFTDSLKVQFIRKNSAYGRRMALKYDVDYATDRTTENNK